MDEINFRKRTQRKRSRRHSGFCKKNQIFASRILEKK
jgi:hypothetical protein